VKPNAAYHITQQQASNARLR